MPWADIVKKQAHVNSANENASAWKSARWNTDITRIL